MQINTKYEMGQKVYRVVERFRRIENVQTCDICFGTGSINYKGYECQCSKCLGKWKNAKTYGNFGRGVVRKEGKYVPSIRFGKRMNRVAQEKADEGEEEVE